MNKKRLLTLAKHLDKVAPKKFNLNEWKCGTVACAVGHACTIPEFNKAGLKMEPGKNRRFRWPIYRSVGEFGPDMSQGWGAVEDFFGLITTEAAYLFHADSYKDDYANPTPKLVAKRIRKFVRNNGH